MEMDMDVDANVNIDVIWLAVFSVKRYLSNARIKTNYYLKIPVY